MAPHPLEQIDLAPLRRLSGSLQHLVETQLWARVLAGLAAGIAVGAALGPSAGLVDPGVAMPIASWLALPGVLFLALVQMIVVPLFGLPLVVVTAVSASIGSPAAPGAGILILAMVLEGAGAPTAGLALILGVDRILDMSRTALNVTGDLTACVVLQRFTEPVAEAA